MPIEFSCPACQVRIRTPDDSVGKQARCPQCGAIAVVPTATVASQAPFSAPVTPTQPANPFAERPPLGLGDALNPYAAPRELAGPLAPGYLSVEQVRSRLLGPAIGMLVFALAGLGFMAVASVGLIFNSEQAFQNVDPDPAAQVGAYSFFWLYFTVGLGTRIVQILGAVAMLRVRSYSLAMGGAICAMIPCEIYCCLPCLPFGIWGLMVLNSAGVKAAFR